MLQWLACELLEDRGVELFAKGHDVRFLDEGHLDIQLAVFERAVRAGVLVAKAARDLEVAVEPADHEDLFQLLRRLRERPELSGVIPRWNDEIASARRVRPDQIGRLDLPEPALDHEATDEIDDLVAQPHEVSGSLPPEIDVSVLPPQRLFDLGLLIDIEGRGLGLVQDLDLVRHDLDVAGRKLRVLRPFRAQTDAAAHAEHPFVTRFAQRSVRRRVLLRVRDDLRDPVPIA